MAASTEKSLNYMKMSHHEHVLLRPDMYIGSTHASTVSTYVADDCCSIVGRDVDLVEGLVRIFIEPLSNAADNVIRSRELGVACRHIHVNVDATRVTIENDGYAIPIKLYGDSDIYLPQMLFGQLLTSSNYDDTEQRYTSGKNGVGVSITNIFSKLFEIECSDPVAGLHYTQTWRDNMLETGAPSIQKYKRKTGRTLVSYVADFARFGGVDGYSSDVVALMRRLVIDVAMITKLDSVTFNGETIPVRGLLEYARLFDGVVYEEMQYVCNDENAEFVIASSIGMEQFSFVNGIHTVHGGVHVDAVYAAVLKPLAEKLAKRVKTITSKDVRSMFTIWVNARVSNPEFTTQNKTKLVAPQLATRIAPLSAHIQSKILKWESVVASLDNMARIKDIATLKKTEKKCRSYKAINGYDPANLCRTKPKECVLIVCEGLSARTFAVTGITVGIGAKKGRDYFGIYALRGKVLNTRNATPEQVTKNREIVDLIQILNLKFSADYSQESEFKNLNYGQILIITDQDTDGYHITGLIMNFFHSLFPSLFYRPGFMASMFTPIMNVYVANTVKRFYSLSEAQTALATMPANTRTKYLKGLGSSNDSDIKETFGKVVCTYTVSTCEQVTREMNKIFSNKYAEDRKKWLQEFDPSAEPFVAASAPFEQYLNTEMIKFSMDDCMRNLPNIYDGLKQSQRKILFAMMKKPTEMRKVSQWAGYVSEQTQYHHGEQCLFDTIIKMAQTFVGSNNVPLLAKDGQFGTRLNGGKDAASARYVFAKIAPIVKYIFRAEDTGVLTFRNEDGASIEPVNFAPIIPMLLVNGCTAIATGWSTSIPLFNPLELVAILKDYVTGSDIDTGSLAPWYRGFHGTIHKESAKKYITRGKIGTSATNPRKFRIVEIPVGTWIDSYKETLEKMLEAKDVTRLVNHSTTTKVCFDVETPEPVSADELYRMFKLESSLNMTNMVVLDGEHGANIQKMATVADILTHFAVYRLDVYAKRKQHQLNAMRAQLKSLAERIRFVRAVISREIVVSEHSKAELVEILATRRFADPETLLTIPMYSITTNNVEALEAKIATLTAQIAALEQTTPNQMWAVELDELEAELKKI